MKTIFIYIGIALTGIGFGLMALMLLIRDKRNYSRLTGSFAQVPNAEEKMFRIGAILVCLGVLIFVIIAVTVGLKVV